MAHHTSYSTLTVVKHWGRLPPACKGPPQSMDTFGLTAVLCFIIVRLLFQILLHRKTFQIWIWQ